MWVVQYIINEILHLSINSKVCYKNKKILGIEKNWTAFKDFMDVVAVFGKKW